MDILRKIIQILHQILSDPERRRHFVSQFCETVLFGDMASLPPKADNIILELYDAIQLYEPDPRLRDDANLYGDEKLEVLVKTALNELEETKSDK